MRHLRNTAKLGRKGQHRNAMLANMVCSLIKKRRITTTLAKAKAARSVAEKMVTLGKKNTQHARRLAAARLKTSARTFFRGTPSKKGKELREKWRAEEDVVHILFDQIAPGYTDRKGGYTRIIMLGQRRGDAAQLAVLEWVEAEEAEEAEEVVEEAEEAAAEEAAAEEGKD